MKFTLAALIKELLESELDLDKKVLLLEKLMKTKQINDGLYLRANEDGTFECWYRNVDENNTIDCGPTNYTIHQVIDEYVKAMESERAMKN